MHYFRFITKVRLLRNIWQTFGDLSRHFTTLRHCSRKIKIEDFRLNSQIDSDSTENLNSADKMSEIDENIETKWKSTGKIERNRRKIHQR